jgi:predicted short-subunit dehydrogenase-like oxidoreductase (DUF2520 family)
MATCPTLNIIGGGRVGRTLAHLWQAQDVFTVQDVLCTSLESAHDATRFIGAGRAIAHMQAMQPADVWMLSVPDTQISRVAQDMAKHAGARTPALAFHCSGALSSEPLAALQTNGWQVASAHCILSFTSASTAVQQFAGTPCALEGQATACAWLHEKFSAIGARCFEVRSQDKLLYHAAAVFATNFVPVLQSVAEDLWQVTGVPEDVRLQLRQDLLQKAVSNINSLGPQGALTGPAARGDTEAIARQGTAVSKWRATAGLAYDALSRIALELAHRTHDHKKNNGDH